MLQSRVIGNIKLYKNRESFIKHSERERNNVNLHLIDIITGYDVSEFFNSEIL